MTRQVLFQAVGGCVALVLLAGCASVKPDGQETQPTASEATNAPATSATARLPPPPPEGGYAWDDLARWAAANSSESKVLLLEAEAQRYQTAVDTGWRNPQVRMGGHWGREEDVTPGRTGPPPIPFTHNAEWKEKEYDGYTAGLRVFLANPFVNQWVRKRGAAASQALEAESEEVQYAVFCEVKSLCLEAEMLREDIGLLEQMSGLREQVRTTHGERAEVGLANALEMIRAETRLAILRAEIQEKQAARQQIIRRIAILADMPAEQVRLRPPDVNRQVNPACLDVAVLTDLAFLRRPDLLRALREKEIAGYNVKAAQAKQIPWIDFVEGSYETEAGRVTSVEDTVAGSDRTYQDESEWQARVAVSLPIFDWLGDEVRLNRTWLAAAEARVQGLYDKIRREVDGVLEDYRSVRTERDRVAADSKRLCDTMTAQMDTLADEATVCREDVLLAREELIEYMRVCLKAERECLRMTQYLESVSGGSLTPSR